MKSIDSRWQRVRASLTSINLRVGLFVLSIAAIVLGGNAGNSWS